MAAQQRVALWAAEPDLDDDINDVEIPLAIPTYANADMYDDPNLQLDESALLAMQAQIAQQAAFAQIPDVVKRVSESSISYFQAALSISIISLYFDYSLISLPTNHHELTLPLQFIVHFHQAVLDNNLSEITLAYESGWNRLTEKFYAKTEWPEAEIIAPLVNDDQIFLILYRELYYRHVYSRLQPNIDDRFHSYENSCELFNYLLNSDGPVLLSLPAQWLWDIIDEFIYQFQSFALFRSRPANKTDDELAMLASEGGAQAWSSYSVLNVLYSLIQKSRVNEWLKARTEGKTDEEIEEVAGEYGARPLYRQLGYFSLIGLLRVHVLLGDFTLALKIVEQVGLGLSLGQKAPFTAPTASHVSTAYHAGAV
ncbi:hypothetical protein HYDPIDRAFT_43113 [Hydnomerulius pinastri MD-312]|uniref:Uncharacterized protein n=1 Tax=Hydnomerulius pinastri MD-312 TaxID=994086 RepID=A0A0C9VSD1_9AGAM|nr:hypothetical protein HYDPIDRAFT_43113 [Hydnomerulius pinastri MD-312]